jgi:hypothetical protein
MHAFLLLALLPAPFRIEEAAELLNLAGNQARARGRLHGLVLAGLLTTHGTRSEQHWQMHCCVRNAANDLSEDIGLGHSLARSCSLPQKTVLPLLSSSCTALLSAMVLAMGLCLQ